MSYRDLREFIAQLEADGELLRVRAVREGVQCCAPFPIGRSCAMTFVPCLERRVEGSEVVWITLGHPLVDGYLEFVGARGATNTWLATAYDLKVFFEVVAQEPAEVTAADVFAFLAQQRAPRRGERVVRIEDGETLVLQIFQHVGKELLQHACSRSRSRSDPLMKDVSKCVSQPAALN